MTPIDEVAIARAPDAEYPTRAPFHPSSHYPEYPFSGEQSSEKNVAYETVRESLHLLRLDEEHFGTAEWNPLRGVVRPGDRVVVKPNFVMHANLGDGPHESVITQPGVLRAVIDYVLIALKSSGSVTIADAPQSDCRFDVLRERIQLDALLAFYRSTHTVPVQFVDVREIVYRWDREKGFLDRNDRVLQSGDPKGYVNIDLGPVSALEGLEHLDRLYGADYDRAETVSAHRASSHTYRISRTMLDSDVFISVPKLKIHRKVGITVNLKGLVGINGNKNYIVHHRIGSPSAGGDEYPSEAARKDRTLFRLNRWLVDRLLPRRNAVADASYAFLLAAYRRLLKPFWRAKATSVRGGDWWGNDTAWRMMIDLAIVLRYADSNGVLQQAPQRRLFSVVDGLIGGQGEGPLRPDVHESKVVVAGSDFFAVDAVCARLMGVDFRKMRWLEAAVRGWSPPMWPNEVNRLLVRSNYQPWCDVADNVEDAYLDFEPAAGWKNVFSWKSAPDKTSLNSWLSSTRSARARQDLSTPQPV